MKKALALVLALVLALSMGVVAFADDALAALITLNPATPEDDDTIDIEVVDFEDYVLYTSQYEGGVYYIALADVAYTDLKVTTTGNVSAELVKFDPEVHEVTGMDIKYYVTRKGVNYATGENNEGYDYETACDLVEAMNAKHVDEANGINDEKVTWYAVKLATNVNIIKITVEDNYTNHYTEGEIKITGKNAEGKAVSAELTVINDIINFEYEEVKYSADHSADTTPATLVVGNGGYSDFYTAGRYNVGADDKYEDEANKDREGAAVISTTAFRAIAGKKVIVEAEDYITVTIKNVAAGQKGVNFVPYAAYILDENGYTEDEEDFDDEAIKSINFGFYGKQVIKGDFTVSFDFFDLTWFELRQLFDIEVEEDDIITYYLLKDGKVVAEYVVDYMTIDSNKAAAIKVDLKDTTLGQYELVLEVPSAEVAEESNPNTGAESVVGVVAALAVVSLASAAAVSLKK